MAVIRGDAVKNLSWKESETLDERRLTPEKFME